MNVNSADIANCTPHAIAVTPAGAESVVTVLHKPDARNLLRLVPTTQVRVAAVDGKYDVVTAPEFTAVEGEVPAGAKYVLVSMPVGQWLAAHPDKFAGVGVLGVDSGPGQAVRDAGGAIIGARRLVLYREVS